MCLTSFCSVSLSSKAASLPNGISAKVEATQTKYSSSDSLTVKVSYTNTLNVPVRLLKWNTALENMVSHDFLLVTLEGNPAPYIGKHVKRLPPSSKDYLTLSPNQTVSSVVDLEGAYAIYQRGEYKIRYRPDHNGALKFSISAAATLNLREDRRVKLLRQTPIINASCNATQRAQINQALAIAERIAITASQDLNNAPVSARPTARRYIEWFGAYSPGRYASVSTGMNRIANALRNQRIGFDCTCDDPRRENLFAFVFTNDPFNMNVCPVFFRVGPSGTDSRSGTIVHEISHFNIVAATDDFSSALNQAGSRALARSNPNNAILNANAYEYFAENTPVLPMPFIDVTVSAASLSNDRVRGDNRIDISGRVTNLGNVTAAATITIRQSVDSVISTTDTTIGQLTISNVQGGGNTPFSTGFTAPSEPGEYFIGVCGSSQDNETNTNNNCSAALKLIVDESGFIVSPIIMLLLDED